MTLSSTKENATRHLIYVMLCGSDLRGADDENGRILQT